MKRSGLKQVLRVRALMEESAQAALAVRVQAVRQLEECAVLARRAALSSRRESLERLALEGQPWERAWKIDQKDAQILDSKSDRLAARAESEKLALAEARAGLLARRRERQQIETLLESVRRSEDQQSLRRSQQQVDDWFQARSARSPSRKES